YRSICGPVPQFFERLATILDDLTIHGFKLPVGGKARNETRYPVNSRPQTSLALTQRLLCPLALGQIEHECDALVAALFEKRGANKHWNAAAVFPNIFLLERRNDPCRVQ